MMTSIAAPEPSNTRISQPQSKRYCVKLFATMNLVPKKIPAIDLRKAARPHAAPMYRNGLGRAFQTRNAKKPFGREISRKIYLGEDATHLNDDSDETSEHSRHTHQRMSLVPCDVAIERDRPSIRLGCGTDGVGELEDPGSK